MNRNTIQAAFAERASEILQTDASVTGLAVGGSWITDEIDAFSDLDLILVTTQKVSGDPQFMAAYAKRLGNLLSAFPGDHVGEPRLLICLYDDPLLHVDIKFLTPGEFYYRVETPTILFDRNDQLLDIVRKSTSKFPYPDYQWIEDRFWTWVHYILLKIGRGEYLEAFDTFSFLRTKVFGPLLHIKNGNLPREIRRVETKLHKEDMDWLKKTLPQYNRKSLLSTLRNAVLLYRQLRNVLYSPHVQRQEHTEQRVMEYFDHIERSSF